MDNVQLSAIGSLIGTTSIVLIYIYLYILYHERYMGIWAASWIVLLSRYILFDSGLLPWKDYSYGIIAYQMLILLSVIMFVWGTYNFLDKPLKPVWIYGFTITSIVSVSISLISSSLMLKLLFPIYICCFIGIWIGITYIRQLNLQGIGHYIIGYAYILWSLLNFGMPLAINISWISPWGYLSGGILRLIIAMGTLLVYFEKNRSDLIKKETQYRLLAEQAIDIIYSYQLSPEPKIEYVSPSVMTTGYTPEQYYANSNIIHDLIHPDDYAIFQSYISDFPNSISLPLTLRLIHKNGTTLWIEGKCVPIYDKKGQLIALQGIIRDISLRKELEKMSSTFDRMNMVGSMAATVAHEIRNPLTTVRGYLQVLGRKEKYQTDKEKFILMTEEIDRANSIIREYLSLCKEKLVNLKQYSLNLIIEALFPLIQADAISSKVNATLNLNPIPNLLVDENEIRQLLLNLIRNSIEAMPRGGQLIIQTQSQDDQVILSVSDQGSGIPDHVLENIGTPFITTKDSGTGLGLPICYQIAHRHNANIKIDTDGSGTTISIFFTIHN
jgi:two-component system sporulation sensor kinase C